MLISSLGSVAVASQRSVCRYSNTDLVVRTPRERQGRAVGGADNKASWNYFRNVTINVTVNVAVNVTTNVTINISDGMASKVGSLMNAELEKMWKETVVA
jgi:hypothetical protein